MNPLTQSKNTTILPILLALALGCFGLSPQARAVCQEGCDVGHVNTFLGEDALLNNTTGFENTAIGGQALFSNTTGETNTAIGFDALYSNTTGYQNTANGTFALWLNTTGSDNTATGYNALTNNVEGNENTANGHDALDLNTTGSNNTANGAFALFRNTTGSKNIALGYLAGQNLTTGSHNIYIGNAGGNAGESRRIRIGIVATHTATFIAGISGATVPEGVGVVVGNDGKLGTIVSSARFKDAIQPMNKASEAILALKPVTFRYKHELDPDGIPQFGLVAEDVAKVNPDLVARDDQGKPYTVRYEAVNAMLLNEFLKAHATISELKAVVANQQEQIATLASQIKAVSNRLELSKGGSRVVATEP